MKKRFLSIMLVVCMICTLLPVSALAATVKDSGTDGNITWSLDENGLLTIGGEGAMSDYTDSYAPWWYDHLDEVKSIVIENGVTSIGYNAFYECHSLKSVVIPDSVSSIGACAFMECSAITNVTIPDSVTQVAYSAFQGCRSLKSVSIPDNVKSIGYCAFHGCSSLTSVTIPGSVTTISDGAFAVCSGLTSAKFEGNAPTTFGSDVFINCASGFKVLAPDNDTWKGEAYNTDAGTWNGYPIEFCHAVHSYGAPVFTWSGFNCSAVIVCSCGDTQPVKCTVTSAVTKEATTRAEGVRTYTATVVIDGQTYTSTKTESIPKLDDGGSTNFFTAIINFIINFFNSILSIFRFK